MQNSDCNKIAILKENVLQLGDGLREITIAGRVLSRSFMEIHRRNEQDIYHSKILTILTGIIQSAIPKGWRHAKAWEWLSPNRKTVIFTELWFKQELDNESKTS